MSHGGQSPPQSTSLSGPFCTPSKQLAPAGVVAATKLDKRSPALVLRTHAIIRPAI
jgi:hypothetical protein